MARPSRGPCQISGFLEKIVKTENPKDLLDQFKRIVLKAYGEKSPDGKYFLKSDEMREKFSQSAAYNSLFMELATNDNAAANFIKGILPKDMSEKPDQDKPASLPQAPKPPVPPNN